MNNYKIFKDHFGCYEAVKQGWSWPAFFFGVIWVFVKRLWILGFALFFASFILQQILVGMVQDMSEEQAIATINSIGAVFCIIISTILAIYGNTLREKNLISRGYQQIAIIAAETPERAIALCLDGKGYSHSQEM